MLAKVNRLVKATEYRLVMRRGQRRAQRHFIGFQYWQDSSYPARIGFVVPKKSVRLATRRNLVKRRLRGAVREHLGEFPPGSLTVFLARPAADKVAYRELDSQLESLIAGWQRPQQKN
nr:ribonuclease P protein component [Mobiluncus mulieris]